MGIISVFTADTVFSCILPLQVLSKFLLQSYLSKKKTQLFYVRFSMKFHGSFRFKAAWRGHEIIYETTLVYDMQC